MPSRKPSAPSWQVILEEIRSQNRSTIEAVEAARAALEQRIDRLDHETRARDGVLELAARQNNLELRELRSSVQLNSLDIGGLKAGVHENSVDIRALTAKVEALSRIEERVAALERRVP